jgi:hypothetical protein
MQVASSDRKVFWVFAVLNPYPWLVFLGIPYLIYRQITNPISGGLFWLFLGSALTVVTFPLLGLALSRRNRRRSQGNVA